MLLIIIRILYAVICAGAIASFVAPSSNPPAFIGDYPFVWFVGLMLFTQAFTLADLLIPRKRLDLISSIYFGLLIGVLLCYLLSVALEPLSLLPYVKSAVIGLGLIVLPYVCISLLLQTRNDFRFVIPYVEFVKEIKGGRPLVVDTSSLIDGRIADLAETKLFDTEMIVPSFVLEELQEIADSNDKLRRTRGRRGLDVLTRLQQNSKVDIRVEEVKEKNPEGLTVDQRIVGLAKQRGGRVLTNDFNLNKVASVQGVDVINLNDVANALRPRYLPGEQLRIKIIREGEAYGQGVGYLDDGTMVICEQGAAYLNRDIDVVVTSVLQNSAGRMIFGRMQGTPAPVPAKSV
ncbi:putative PIN and TRAM-domain containing protein precursor [Planctopirus ephydatiae]|uniref:Putative PIN and TRAM-domain containing protein n=1 Tax=Planctopirus ephydatiae TaxID=2528019 RepID=A0A518GN36_9PLAN|nr:PIN domain-containing protein [Planctopirus ephydatiae]QDV30028.1 putative PIN and TRAM-domain containing protein precursor [Planctopirus ephydatiae]